MKSLLPTVLLLLLLGCGVPASTRDGEIARVLSHANELTARTRPALLAGQYDRMATTPFEFYRGDVPIFRHDWETGRNSASAFLGDLPPVWGLGDPHPENFAVLYAGDGTPGLEPNDFDSADRVPYLFDLRRLVCGLGVGVRLSNSAADVAAVGQAGARSYATTLSALANGTDAHRIVTDEGSAIVADVFRRAARDRASRSELSSLTVVTGTQRTLIRGVLDPADPSQTFADLPGFARDGLQAVVTQALGRDPRFTVLDAVREFGSGVASWPKVRMIVLVRGPTDALDDDALLEVKELGESGLAGWYAPELPALDTPARVLAALRRLWFRPDADPNWSTAVWGDLPLQVRTEADSNKNLRISRWTGARATQAELENAATVLGELLARMHSRSEHATVVAIAATLNRDVDAFASEQGAFADACSTSTIDDFAAFGRDLTTLGPLLGYQPDSTTQPAGPIAALFGTPP